VKPDGAFLRIREVPVPRLTMEAAMPHVSLPSVPFHKLFAAVALAFFSLAFSPAARADEVPPADAKAVQEVIDGQIGAFRAQDHAKAYSFAAPGIRQVFPTVEGFMAMVTSGYQPVYDPESYTFGRNIAVGGQVHQELLITARDGKLWQAVYTLQKQEDGSWKVTGVKLNPFKGESV